MVHFYTLLVLSLLLPHALLLFYTLYICNKNICTYVLAMILPGVLAVALWRDVPKVAWLSHCHVEFFKVILLSHWHVELSKDMKNTSYQFDISKIQVHFLLLEGYILLLAIILSRGGSSRLCCCHIDALSSPRTLQGYQNTSYHFDICHFNYINKTDWC